MCLCANRAAQKEFETAYPPIDADPHFRRVVRYFRPSDYYAMAGATVAFPGALYLMENADPARGKGKLGAAMKLSAFLGLCGGFLYASQRSTCMCGLLTYSPLLGLDRE